MLKRYLVIVAVICLGVTAAAFDVRQIVVPDNPAAVEKYAAELLANYLEKVFNRRFPIVRSSVLPPKGSCCVGPFFAEKGLGCYRNPSGGYAATPLWQGGLRSWLLPQKSSTPTWATLIYLEWRPAPQAHSSE